MSYTKSKDAQGWDLFEGESLAVLNKAGSWFKINPAISKADYNKNLCMRITGKKTAPTTRAAQVTAGRDAGESNMGDLLR